ncbi:MAG TPA: inosine/xanthosine triphosphatase [Archaeoglobus veneficus]|nr:inosine/xanthosine triphosphatase [Archaeoglobus veneficus]
MRVIVGSSNPAKIEGVRIAFQRFFSNVEIEAKNADSGVSDQPFNNETVRGAINRAINVYSKEFDFSVGIEAGLFRLKNTMTGYLDFQVAAIYNGSRITIGFGPGFEYPPAVIKEVVKGKEVGDIMSRITGIERLGEKQGAIGYLTKNTITRSKLTSIAVTMALIPWINPDLYF